LVSSTESDTIGDRQRSLARILAANAEVALGRAEREAERERQRERLERFASIVSHDLRDPLQTAKATLAVARAGDESALDDLDRVFDRMDELIEDVLTLAKQGKAVGETERVDTAEVVAAAWSTVDAADATLETDDPPTVSADRERLRTLFENLFRNSVEHGSTSNRATPDGAIEHAGPAVTVTVGALDAGAGFYVADDGPGLGDADADRLFEYGYSTESDNTGFGLNIVHDIAEAHGWRIAATTGADGGARFEVETR